MNGAWNLHRLTQDMPLDFFVTFSSAAAILGSAGQVNYAAANAFLDGLAQYRQSQGRPSLSVNWGAWDNVGMTAALSAQDQRRIARQGLNALGPEEALTALEAAMRTTRSQIAILSVDWPHYLEQSASTDRPFFADFAEAAHRAHAKKETASPVKPELLRRWPDTPPSKRRGVLQSYLRGEAIRILGLPASQAIDPRQPLNALGLDSLMAVEMRNALSASLSCPLPATLLFDYPTIETLSDYLMNNVPSLASETPAPSVERDEKLNEPVQGVQSDGLENITEEEAEAMLLEELESLRKRI
jgi:myxalamid-type polyketide synthase MxaB